MTGLNGRKNWVFCDGDLPPSGEQEPFGHEALMVTNHIRSPKTNTHWLCIVIDRWQLSSADSTFDNPTLRTMLYQVFHIHNAKQQHQKRRIFSWPPDGLKKVIAVIW